MKIPKITTGFSALSDANLLEKANSIFTSMNGNTNFPAPLPALADVQAAINDYSLALTAAQSRDKNDVAVKNQKRQDLIDVLNSLATYVTFTAGGDRIILVSSGYDLAKEGGSAPLPKPENLQVDEGINPGELVVSVTAVKGARCYVHQYTADPVTDASTWTNVTSTASKYTFKNLGGTKKYWCRVAAVGAFDQVVISDTISRVVQ